MKNFLMVFVMLLSLTPAYSQSTVTCGTCNGYKTLMCSSCNGSGIVYSQVWNPYYGCYQTVQQYCGYCGGRGAITCNKCGGYGYLVVNNQLTFRGNSNILYDSNRICPNSTSKTYRGYDNGNNGYIVDTDKCLNCNHMYYVHKKR